MQPRQQVTELQMSNWHFLSSRRLTRATGFLDPHKTPPLMSKPVIPKDSGPCFKRTLRIALDIPLAQNIALLKFALAFGKAEFKLKILFYIIYLKRD